MHLADVSSSVAIDVIRDANFENLGVLANRRDRMLAFLQSEAWFSSLLDNPSISAVITTKALAGRLPERYGVAVAASPRRTFFELHNYLARHTAFYTTPTPTEIDPTARIHPTAHVAPTNVRVEAGAIIEAGAHVLEGTTIGRDVILRTGCTIGSPGFNFTRIDGGILSIEHVGGVVLADRVEVQSNSTVDRGLFRGNTEIGEDTKIDNLVHVGHDVQIGKRCLIASGATIGGGVTIGEDVWVGIGVTITNAITVASRAEISIGAVVIRSVEPGQRVTGNFAIEHRRFLRQMALNLIADTKPKSRPK